MAMTRKTPSSVARQLRQEAGFGCCVCGSPIIQYHHIIEWSDEEHFRPEDMMALCPLCHDRATKGAMPKEEQRKHKKEPHNINRGYANGLLAIRQDYCAAQLGSITVVGEGTFLRCNGEDMFGLWMGEGNLEVSLKLFDESGELILEIDRNEWISGDPLPWDIEADWQVLTLREKARKISISLNAKTVPMELMATFLHGATNVTIDRGGISLGTEKPSTRFENLALVGGFFTLNDDGTLSFSPQQQNKHVCFVAAPNSRERLYKAKVAWRKIVQGETP